MSTATIITVPLSQFPPCCGTCRHWVLRMCNLRPLPPNGYAASLIFKPTPFNGTCEHHKPREISDAHE